MRLTQKQYEMLLAWAKAQPLRKAFISFACRILPWIAAAAYGLCCLHRMVLLAALPWDMLLPVGLTFLLATLLRHFLPLERPFRRHHLTPLAPHEAGHSFPSRHSACAMALVLAVRPAYPLIAAGLAVLALIIGLSRVLAVLHEPRDVLGGYLLAFVCRILILSCLPWFLAV